MSDIKLNIIKFEKKITPRADVVDALEGILKLAKEGKIEGVYIAAVHIDGDISTCFSHVQDMFKALGAVEWLKKRVTDVVSQ